MRRNSVVVIGAGMAGLVAARVLAERFGQVVVVDRDHLPDSAQPRRGVPQGRAPHTVLLAGQNALGDLFPQIQGELIKSGASVFDAGSDLLVWRFGELWPRVPFGFDLITMSRPLLEVTVRRRVAALPGVTIRDGVAVAGLVGDDRAGVIGARLDDGDVILSDLVVDCSGRSSRSDRWLSALGYPAPDTDEVKIGVGYACRLLRRKPTDLPSGRALMVVPTAPQEKRIGVALPVEDDQWLVSVGGWHGEAPAADEAAFLAFARSLPYGGFGDLVETAEPLTDVFVHRYPSSRWRRFDRLRRLPAGYLALGDAIASFNPTYGQGITVAVLEAQALGRELDRAVSSAWTAGRYYRAAARLVAVPWRFAVSADYLYPETNGAKPLGVDLFNRYSLRIQHAARNSTDVRRRFIAVQHLIAPPSDLMRPGMIVKVLRARS
jgi:flavin-dependent dehydrogenase